MMLNLRILFCCAMLFGLASSTCSLTACTSNSGVSGYCSCLLTEINGCTASTADSIIKSALEASRTGLQCGGSQLTTNMTFLTVAAVLAWALNFR